MATRIVIFETRDAAAGFGPLARIRPVYDLLLGARRLVDKAAGAFLPLAPEVAPRAELAALEARRGRAVFRAATLEVGDDVILLSGDLVVTPDVARAVEESPSGTVFRHGRVPVGARLDGARLRAALGKDGAVVPAALEAAGAGSLELEARRVLAPWDLVDANAAEIEREWELLAARLPASGWPEVDPRAALLEPGRIRLEAGARVDAMAVLDARSGPILLCEGAEVAPFARVIGPAVIGRGARVLGGRVGTATSVGPQCRVNGEVEASVLFGFSNKAHDGFLGHAVVAEWVNLGAMTTNSDLKNNYGTVRVRMDEREVDTGMMKVGVFLGDHVKTGIGTLLPTGGVVDVGSNLFGGGVFVPRWVPAFTWWDGRAMGEHRFAAFVETARRAMERRSIACDEETERVFAKIFNETAGARVDAGASADGRSQVGERAHR